MIHVGVIGYGYWGPNLVRNFFEQPDAWISAVCDLRPERIQHLSKRYPSIQTTTDVEELLGDPRIDAVAIATPVSSHYDLAMRALEAGKHVLVEKPMADSSERAIRMLDKAQEKNRVLMVDHTFVYTGAVRAIKQLIDQGDLGRLYYYDSVRVNLGLFQHDVNVIWDLAVHDLAIMEYLLEGKPTVVSATGTAHLEGKPENVAYLSFYYPDNTIAHVHVNWLAPAKIRQTLIGGDRKMIVYDDLEPSEKVKVYDKGVTLHEAEEGDYALRVGYRAGDMWAPKLDECEALTLEAGHFLDCIDQDELPLTDGEAGVRVVRQLEAATQSMAQQGHPVEL